MMQGEQGRRLSRLSDVLSRRMLDGVVILAPDRDDPVQITGPGADIWDLLSEPRTAEEIVCRLMSRYREDGEAVRADTAALLERLVDYGAVEVHTARN